MENQSDKPNRTEKLLASLAESAKANPEINGQLNKILVSLSNIVSSLESVNANPKQVAKQLSAASIFLDSLQTMGRDTSPIESSEPGIDLASHISKAVEGKVAKASKPATSSGYFSSLPPKG